MDFSKVKKRITPEEAVVHKCLKERYYCSSRKWKDDRDMNHFESIEAVKRKPGVKNYITASIIWGKWKSRRGRICEIRTGFLFIWYRISHIIPFKIF